MACRNSVRTAQFVNSGLAFSPFESLMWVGLETPDAHRPTVERVERSPHRSQAAIKRLWRGLAANADGVDLEGSRPVFGYFAIRSPTPHTVYTPLSHDPDTHPSHALPGH